MPDLATPTTTTDDDTATELAERGHSRRAFLGRAGVAGAAGAALVAGVAPSTAGAAETAPVVLKKTSAKAVATRATAAPALPSAAAVKALNKPLVDHEIFELAALLRAGATTALELAQAYLDRIERFNGPFEVYGDNAGFNTFVRIAREEALDQARAADVRIAAERAGGAAAPILCGIPLGIKDSVGIAGRPSKNGTHAFDNNIALEDSTAVARLRDQGVVFLGHCICSAYSGVIAGNFAGNAWNKDYVPGGSSQGSGGAPINRLAAAAIGEETGGSITWPAAINGSSAIKPSLGLGSMAGVMPLSATYDVLGPLARSGRDAALIMNAMIGPDGDNDPQTLAAPIPFPELPMAPREGSKPLKGLTIGIPQTDWMTTSTYNAAKNSVDSVVDKRSPQAVYDADHKAAFDRVRGELEAMGATVKEFRGCDITDFGTAASGYLDGDNPYYNNPMVLETIDGTGVTPRNAVVLSNRAEIRYIEAVKAFSDAQTSTDVQTQLITQYGRRAGGATADAVPAVPITLEASAALNAGITAKARNEGERRRRLLIANYQKSLDDAGVDIMLVMSIGAEVGKRNPANASDGLPVRRNNQIANDMSWPLVSFPVGVTSKAGLPICVQLWGPRFSEPRLVQAMIDYQAKHPEHHTRFPADPANVPPKTLSPMLARRAAAGEAGPVDPMATNDPAVTEFAAMD